MPLEDAPKDILDRKENKSGKNTGMSRPYDFPMLSLEDSGQFSYN